MLFGILNLLCIVAKVGQLISMGVSAVRVKANMQIGDLANGKYRFGMDFKLEI